MADTRTSLVLVLALSFLTLGGVNTYMGWAKMDEYRAKKHAAIAAGAEPVRDLPSGTESILDPTTDAQVLYESASIKYEYYRIVRRGGFWFLGIAGTLLTGLGVRRVARTRS